MLSNGTELMMFMEKNCFECTYYDYEDTENISKSMIDIFFDGELEADTIYKEKRAYNG